MGDETVTMTAPEWVNPTDVTHVRDAESGSDGAYKVRSDRTIAHVAPEHVDLLSDYGFRVVDPKAESADRDDESATSTSKTRKG